MTHPCNDCRKACYDAGGCPRKNAYYRGVDNWEDYPTNGVDADGDDELWGYDVRAPKKLNFRAML